MGRPSDLPCETTAELHVRKVPIADGFDPGGTYWGLPDNLWCVWYGPDINVDGDVREAIGASIICIRGGYPDLAGEDLVESVLRNAQVRVEVRHEQVRAVLIPRLTRYLRATDLDSAKAQFPRATWATETGPSDGDIDDMLDAYIGAALFSTNDESTPDGGLPLDQNYSRDDIADETIKAMRADVEKFARENGATVAACLGRRGRYARQDPDWSLAGYHFWMERSGSGVGFEDGDWPEPEAKVLAKAARAFGTHVLYVGDDKRIHGD
jgi:hypothetical protein